MSLIEQAAKRLEELKKTGINVVDSSDSVIEPVIVDAPGKSTSAPVQDLLAARRENPDLVRAKALNAEALNQAALRGKFLDLDLPRLAASGLVTPDAPHSPLANEFRVIKRPLLANTQSKAGVPIKSSANLIMITSAMPGEGKSFSALNLAMSMAMEMDSTVLLIDADVANPTLLKRLGISPAKGLMDVLTDDTLRLSDVIMRTNVEKLCILPAGTPHQRATELLASDAMVDLTAEMAARYGDRVLIFDSPPLLPTTESRVLAAHMGQVVVVVEADVTTHGTLKQALAHLEACPVVMTMLNKAARSEVGQYYGYYGYARATPA